MSTVSDPSRKIVLLMQITDWVLQNGLDGFSLRAVADDVGTSARMLVYHFDTREGLLTQVLEQVAKRWMGGVRFSDNLALSDQLADMWDQHLTTDQAHSLHTVTLQLWATGLAGRAPMYAPFIDILSRGWVELIAAHMVAQGVPAQTALTRSTLCVAAIEGLLLHRISDPTLPTDAAFAELLAVLRGWEKS